MKQDKVKIFDTTLRDGEQAPGYSMNLDEKVRLALQLENLGVDIIEGGFPVASRGDFESVKAIAAAIKNATVAGLSRALTKDIDAAAAAIKNAVYPRIHTFVATSDFHLKYKLKMSRTDVLKQTKAMVAYARKHAAEVEFSAEDASRTSPDFLCRVIETAVNAGASIINLPDTVGYSTPDEFGAMVADVCRRVPNIDRAIISVHCHNDLGLAVINTLAGIRAGARQAECTVCGIGERAGNAALEEIVMGLRTRRDYFNGVSTGIITERLAPTARMLSSITGVKIPPNKAIVGANAFAHESGIHQHGILANAKTYEIMTPESVGAQQTSLILGKHSGRHAFESRLKELGYILDAKRTDTLFENFKSLADRKKNVEDRDIIALIENMAVVFDPERQWVLDSFVVNSGNKTPNMACVTLKRGKKLVREVAIGSGPVFAAIRAVEKIIHHPFRLEDYQLQAVTERRDALGEVRVKISDEKGTYRGRGVSTDVIEASILACLAGVNSMIESNGQALGTGAASSIQHGYSDDMLHADH